MESPSARSTLKRGKKDNKGFIKMKVYFDTAAGHLVAEIREGRNLSKPGTPFVKIQITADPKGTKQRTLPIKEKTADPVWNEGFRWPLPDPRVQSPPPHTFARAHTEEPPLPSRAVRPLTGMRSPVAGFS